jgi:hypothetical protein
VGSEKESIGQARELIVVSQSIESLLIIEQLRLDLALNRPPMLGLFEKLCAISPARRRLLPARSRG